MQTGSEQPDLVFVGAGVMSATLAVLLKELDPSMKIEVLEQLESGALESSLAWNNAGTGHSAPAPVTTHRSTRRYQCEWAVAASG